MATLKKCLYWLLGLVLAYLLSVGPYVYTVGKDWLPDWAKHAGNACYAPERWLEKQPGFYKPLDGYKRWWWRLSQKGTPK